MLGRLAQLYVHPRAVVPGDAAATAANVAADSTLFQLFFAGELVSITAFLLVAMALYRLLAALVATAWPAARAAAIQPAVALRTSD